jgi:hypothetical protein
LLVANLKRSTTKEPGVWRSTLAKWKIDAATLDNGPELVEAIDRVLELLREADRP